MTTVFERELSAGPVTHAFVLGCGRFPWIGKSAERQSTVAGAREMVRYLLAKQDSLIAPLASIECLISDPARMESDDTLGIGDFACDPRQDDSVHAVNTATVTNAGLAWLNRCKRGDHMFLYMSSHGVAGPDLSAYALFEDALANPYNRWSASLNVNLLATNLPVIGAGACWIFLDACQELVQDVLGQYDGVAGVILVKATAQEVANTRVRSLALAGSRFGHSAWGPDGPEPPYFTRALLRSFEACIDRDVAGEWVVTGERLLFHVPRVADAAFGDGQTEVEALSRFANHASFVKVANARVPVVIRTRNAADMAYLVSVTADDGVHVPIRSHPQQANCFLDVPPNGSAWQATPLFDGSCTYRPGKFFANPCAQVVYLEP